MFYRKNDNARQLKLRFSSGNWFGKQFKLIRQATALMLCFAVLVPGLSWAFEGTTYPIGQQSVNYGNKVITIAKSDAKIVSKHVAGRKMVIHIHDLHCNYEVQSKIASIIDYLSKEHDLKLIAIEGASKPINVTHLSSYPRKDIREKVGRYFMKTGKLSGAEFITATSESGLLLDGIEKETFYKESSKLVKAFLNDETQGYLYDLQKYLNSIKEKVFNPELLALHHKKQAYFEGDIPYLKYAGTIIAYAHRHQVNLSAYENIKSISEHGQYKDRSKLYEEVENLEHVLTNKLIVDSAEQELTNLEINLDTIGRLLNISATAIDLANLIDHPEQYMISRYLNYITKHLGEQPLYLDPEIRRLDKYMDQVKRFYILADARSSAFVDNTLRFMDQYQTPIAVLITGGYHTDKIIDEFKNRQVGYLSLEPTVTREDVINPYFTIIQGRKTPLEKLLARNQTMMSAEPMMVPVEHAAERMNIITAAQEKALAESLKVGLLQLRLTFQNVEMLTQHEAGNRPVNQLEEVVEKIRKNYAYNNMIDVDWSKAEKFGDSLLVMHRLKSSGDRVVTALIQPKNKLRSKSFTYLEKMAVSNSKYEVLIFSDSSYRDLKKTLSKQRQQNRTKALGRSVTRWIKTHSKGTAQRLSLFTGGLYRFGFNIWNALSHMTFGRALKWGMLAILMIMLTFGYQLPGFLQANMALTQTMASWLPVSLAAGTTVVSLPWVIRKIREGKLLDIGQSIKKHLFSLIVFLFLTFPAMPALAGGLNKTAEAVSDTTKVENVIKVGDDKDKNEKKKDEKSSFEKRLDATNLRFDSRDNTIRLDMKFNQLTLSGGLVGQERAEKDELFGGEMGTTPFLQASYKQKIFKEKTNFGFERLKLSTELAGAGTFGTISSNPYGALSLTGKLGTDVTFGSRNQLGIGLEGKGEYALIRSVSDEAGSVYKSAPKGFKTAAQFKMGYEFQSGWDVSLKTGQEWENAGLLDYGGEGGAERKEWSPEMKKKAFAGIALTSPGGTTFEISGAAPVSRFMNPDMSNPEIYAKVTVNLGDIGSVFKGKKKKTRRPRVNPIHEDRQFWELARNNPVKQGGDIVVEKSDHGNDELIMSENVIKNDGSNGSAVIIESGKSQNQNLDVTVNREETVVAELEKEEPVIIAGKTKASVTVKSDIKAEDKSLVTTIQSEKSNDVLLAEHNERSDNNQEIESNPEVVTASTADVDKTGVITSTVSDAKTEQSQLLASRANNSGNQDSGFNTGIMPVLYDDRKRYELMKFTPFYGTYHMTSWFVNNWHQSSVGKWQTAYSPDKVQPELLLAVQERSSNEPLTVKADMTAVNGATVNHADTPLTVREKLEKKYGITFLGKADSYKPVFKTSMALLEKKIAILVENHLPMHPYLLRYSPDSLSEAAPVLATQVQNKPFKLTWAKDVMKEAVDHVKAQKQISHQSTGWLAQKNDEVMQEEVTVFDQDDEPVLSMVNEPGLPETGHPIMVEAAVRNEPDEKETASLPETSLQREDEDASVLERNNKIKDAIAHAYTITPDNVNRPVVLAATVPQRLLEYTLQSMLFRNDINQASFANRLPLRFLAVLFIAGLSMVQGLLGLGLNRKSKDVFDDSSDHWEKVKRQLALPGAGEAGQFNIEQIKFRPLNERGSFIQRMLRGELLGAYKDESEQNRDARWAVIYLPPVLLNVINLLEDKEKMEKLNRFQRWAVKTGAVLFTAIANYQGEKYFSGFRGDSVTGLFEIRKQKKKAAGENRVTSLNGGMALAQWYGSPRDKMAVSPAELTQLAMHYLSEASVLTEKPVDNPIEQVYRKLKAQMERGASPTLGSLRKALDKIDRLDPAVIAGLNELFGQMARQYELITMEAAKTVITKEKALPVWVSNYLLEELQEMADEHDQVKGSDVMTLLQQLNGETRHNMIKVFQSISDESKSLAKSKKDIVANGLLRTFIQKPTVSDKKTYRSIAGFDESEQTAMYLMNLPKSFELLKAKITSVSIQLNERVKTEPELKGIIERLNMLERVIKQAGVTEAGVFCKLDKETGLALKAELAFLQKETAAQTVMLGKDLGNQVHGVALGQMESRVINGVAMADPIVYQITMPAERSLNQALIQAEQLPEDVFALQYHPQEVVETVKADRPNKVAGWFLSLGAGLISRKVKARIDFKYHPGRYLLSRINRQLRPSTLSRLLRDEESPVREAYNEWTHHPGDQKKQLEFVKTMLRVLSVQRDRINELAQRGKRQGQWQHQVDHIRSIAIFNDLMAGMDILEGQNYGSWIKAPEGTRSKKIVIPSVLFESGNMGALGSLLDMLEPQPLIIDDKIYKNRRRKIFRSTAVSA